MNEDTKEKNNSILYCDDLIKTSISGIRDEYLLECLDKIVESNPDATFSLIQYSKRDRRIYFYTDRVISTKQWEPPKLQMPKKIITKVEVLEEIKKLLLSEEKEDNNCISIYDRDDVISLNNVIKLVKSKQNEYEKTKSEYEEKLKYLYRSKEGTSAHIFISDFYFEPDELKIAFTSYSLGDYTYILFKKDSDGDMKGIKESGYHDPNDIMVICGGIISEAHEKLSQFKEFKTQKRKEIRTINSRFIIDIDNYGIDIKCSSRVFELSFRSYSDDVKYECNSQDIINLLKGNEAIIAKKILVRIEDCPEWMHGSLYDARAKQLEQRKKEKELEDIERRKKEEKEQKQLKKQERAKQFKKRFLPFLKVK